MPIYRAHFVFQTLIFRPLSDLRYSAPDSNSGGENPTLWCGLAPPLSHARGFALGQCGTSKIDPTSVIDSNRHVP